MVLYMPPGAAGTWVPTDETDWDTDGDASYVSAGVWNWNVCDAEYDIVAPPTFPVWTGYTENGGCAWSPAPPP